MIGLISVAIVAVASQQWFQSALAGYAVTVIYASTLLVMASNLNAANEEPPDIRQVWRLLAKSYSRRWLVEPQGKPTAGRLDVAGFGPIEVRCKIQDQDVWVNREPLMPKWIMLKSDQSVVFDRTISIDSKISITIEKPRYLR